MANVFLAFCWWAHLSECFTGINFMLILLIAGLLTLLIVDGWPRLKETAPTILVTIVGVGLLLPFTNSRRRMRIDGHVRLVFAICRLINLPAQTTRWDCHPDLPTESAFRPVPIPFHCENASRSF